MTPPGRKRIDPSEPTRHLTLRLPASVVEAIRERGLRGEVTQAILKLVRRRAKKRR
jgi:ribosomal protein S28E/S33